MSTNTPAGWFPDPEQPGRQRYWDGVQWTEHRAPGVAPVAPNTAVAPGYQPPAKSNTLRNVLLVIGVLLILLVGGCVAVVALGVNAVDDAVQDAQSNNDRPGGVDNPLPIKPGEAFEVDGFNYAAGWSATSGVAGLEINGLKVTNNRGKRDPAIVEIKFLRGAEVLALANCFSEPITPGQTVTLACSSTDPLPKRYTEVTINDSF